MNMKSNLSKYSVHYRDMDPATADRAHASLQRKIEDFRLKLDLEKILPWIKGPDVLDFPIGTGRFYPHLLSRYNVFGYDIAGEYVRRAAARSPEIATHFAEYSFEAVEAIRLFDTVVTLRTLNNVDDTELAVRNVTSILKPEGRWIFNYPSSGARYAELPEFLSRYGLRVIYECDYDFHAGAVHEGSVGQRIYSRYLRLMEAGMVPYAAFRAVEFVFGSRGTHFFVCEKSAS